MKLLDPNRSMIIAFRDHHASSLLAAASLLFTVLLGHRIPSGDAGKKFIKPETCPSSDYFHTFSLRCVPCWNQSVPLWLANQTAVISPPPPSDRSQCYCPDQYRMRLTNGRFDCIPIAACREAEPRVCSQCHSSLLSSSSLSADGHNCRDNCPQPLGHVLEDGQCLPEDKIISTEKLLSFSTIHYHRRSKSSLVSKFIYSSLRPALFNCRFHLNQTACQYLINVLSLKSAAEQLGVTGKQDSFQALREKIHEALVDGFNLTGSDHSSITGNSPTSVDQRFREQFQCQRSRSPGNNRLDLLDLQFRANGSLLQFGATTLDQLSPCSSSSHHHQSGLDDGRLFVGVHLHRQFWCRADQLGTRNTENTFHQLFSSSQSANTEDLYPFLNPSGAGRFFLANTLLGQDAFKPDGAGPEFILYARSITLVIMVQQWRSDTPSIPSICPESIRIQYDSLDGQTAVDKLVRTELKVQYRMADNLDPDLDHQISMIFGLVIILLLVIVWSGFRTWCLMNRNGQRRWDWKIFAIFAHHLIVVSISNILLVAILVWCLNRTMVYKYQTVVHVLMLDHDQELAVVHCLLIIFCVKMVQLMTTIRHSTSIEMFLIDWEKPKNNNNQKNDHFDHFLGKSSSNNNNNNLVVEMINKKWRSKYQGEPAIPEAMMDNVSVWRRIFVANEWSELSTVRRINLSLHLLLLTTILESAYFHRFYKLAPELYFTSTMVDNLDDEIPESLTIRMTITATIYLALVLIQYLYQKWIKENFFGSKLREFVDLCSVSNISVFCLVHRKYGYYIHGLSPHGQSDVGMLQMYRLLDIEQSDLCSKRGLLPNTDQQTFQMYLPTTVHDYLQAIRNRTRSTGSEDSKKRSMPADDYGNDDPIQSMRISAGINQFLTSFIAHQFPKADYIVEEKRGLQAMFDFESDQDSDSVSEGIGFFYNDSNDLMENVLLYGLEPTMIIIELMIYLLMDVWWQNFIIAALITYCASMAIRRLFGQLFRQNLIRKALIDERFLF